MLTARSYVLQGDGDAGKDGETLLPEHSAAGIRAKWTRRHLGEQCESEHEQGGGDHEVESSSEEGLHKTKFIVHTLGLKTVLQQVPEIAKIWGGAWRHYDTIKAMHPDNPKALWEHYLKALCLRTWFHRPSMLTTLFHIKDPAFGGGVGGHGEIKGKDCKGERGKGKKGKKGKGKGCKGNKDDRPGRGHTGTHPEIIQQFKNPLLQEWRHAQYDTVVEFVNESLVCWHALTTTRDSCIAHVFVNVS